jgi:metal-dependent amidase/aminoacylase/carboxypeptidase family protein
MNQENSDFNDALTTGINELLPELEEIYKDLHANPELSFQETRTAEIAARHLRVCCFAVTEKNKNKKEHNNHRLFYRSKAI